MALHPDNIQGYNNKVVIAGSVGHNPGINQWAPISGTTGDKSFEGKIAAPAGTDHMGLPSGRLAGSPTPVAATDRSHEEEKTAPN